jgi:hypothetical protein
MRSAIFLANAKRSNPSQEKSRYLLARQNESSRAVDTYVIKSVKDGPLRTNLDNIGEVIAEVEGAAYR